MINLKEFKEDLLMDMVYSLHQLNESEQLNRFVLISKTSSEPVLRGLVRRIPMLAFAERAEAFWILANKPFPSVWRDLVATLETLPHDEIKFAHRWLYTKNDPTVNRAMALYLGRALQQK